MCKLCLWMHESLSSGTTAMRALTVSSWESLWAALLWNLLFHLRLADHGGRQVVRREEERGDGAHRATERMPPRESGGQRCSIGSSWDFCGLLRELCPFATHGRSVQGAQLNAPRWCSVNGVIPRGYGFRGWAHTIWCFSLWWGFC